MPVVRFVSSTVSLFLCVCALALAACGGGDSSSGDDELASLAPSGTPFYLEFTTQPSDEQKATIESLISRFGPETGLSEGTDFDQAIQDLLDKAAAADDSGYEVSYADDIQSWLGAKGAFWLPDVPQDYDTQPDSVDTPAAFIVESTDDDAAQAFIDKAIEASGEEVKKKEIDGIEVEVGSNDTGAIGLDDGFLIVASTDEAFSAAVDARDGDSLGDEDAFQSSFEDLSDETFASAYIDPKPFVEKNSQIDPQQLDAFNQVFPDFLETPITLALGATTDSISLDASGISGSGASGLDSSALDQVPSDALAALAFGNLGDQLSKGIDQIQSYAESSGQANFDPDQIDQALQAQTGFSLSDIEDTLGTADLYVSGDFPDSYVVGIQIGLEQDASDLIDKLKTAIGQAPQNSGARIGPSLMGDGFSLQLPPQTDPTDARYFDFAFEPDQATILISPSKQAIAATENGGSLTDSPAFTDATDALGDEFSPLAFADFTPIVDAIESSGGTTDPDSQLVLDFLRDQASYFAAGVGSDGGSLRVTLGLKPDAGQ
ncbi:hypothetical protein BH10ACT11_BH10ACT11_05440 [soil metagenome]